MSEAPALDGAAKAAVLLMTLGEQVAAEVLRHMGPREVQRVGAAMANLENVPRSAVEATLAEFVGAVREKTALGVGTEEYVRNVLVQALGEEKAASMLDQILLGASARGLESLRWMDARAVYELLRDEHPQIVALVLAHLEAEQAAAVLALFPDETRAQLLLRVANLDAVTPAAVGELNEVLERQIKARSAARPSPLGGPRVAADILNRLPSEGEGGVLERIRAVDEELGQQLEELMFVFDDLARLDDRAMQTLLREVSTDVLVVALKGADPAVQELVFRNMSQRAAEMLKDDLEAKGPVRLAEVEAAQKEILATARRLAEEGQIALGTGSEEMVA